MSKRTQKITAQAINLGGSNISNWGASGSCAEESRKYENWAGVIAGQTAIVKNPTRKLVEFVEGDEGPQPPGDSSEPRSTSQTGVSDV